MWCSMSATSNSTTCRPRSVRSGSYSATSLPITVLKCLFKPLLNAPTHLVAGELRKGSPSVFREFASKIDYFMTYRQDSDIVTPYGKISKRPTPAKPKTVDFGAKTKDTVWFVSKCVTQSRREDIASQLRHFVDIDVYGQCGALNCPRVPMSSWFNCLEQVARTYKFYLSFENSLCGDYVTEKLFYILNYDMIPIVYGAANYSAIMPPNSYIDVQNFTSIKQLADYVIHVGSDEKLYSSYFDWKRDYRVININRPCQVCQIFGAKHLKPRREDFSEWRRKSCKLL